jgi:type I restriction enzyme S subunit
MLSTKSFREEIALRAHGAANQANVSANDIRGLKIVHLPPLETQRKIAGILSAYDDLMENNRRRIAILERMAEELYREWFVRMRFPGYQNTKFVKSVPEGWEVLSFDRVVDLKPNESLNSGEHYPFVPMEQLSCTSMYFEYADKRKSPSGPRFRNGDVLFPRITPSVENGKRGFVSCLADDEIGIGSTEFIVMRQKKISAEHIYFLTISKEFRTHAEQSMVGASGRQRVHEKCFSSFLVQVPCESVRNQFEMAVQPIFRQISILAKTAKELERHRTTLLGRLISSRCPVDHLDIRSPTQAYERSEQTVKQELAHA